MINITSLFFCRALRLLQSQVHAALRMTEIRLECKVKEDRSDRLSDSYTEYKSRVGQIDVLGWGAVLDYLQIPHDTFNAIHLLSTRGRFLTAQTSNSR